MNTPLKSGYEKTGGMAYFSRMLDKIRLHANLGRGADIRVLSDSKFLTSSLAM
jgi:hypothetical protein